MSGDALRRQLAHLIDGVGAHMPFEEAVAGSIIYPPIMGFLSVTVGLTVAMAGNVIIGLACAGALILVGRSGGTRAARA